MNYSKKEKASLTVEAALVLPIFLYTIITFLYFIQAFIAYETVQAGITEVAKYAAKYAYLYENIDNSNSDIENETTQDNQNQVSQYSKDKKIEVLNHGETDNDENNEITDTSENKSSTNSNYDQLAIIDNIFYKHKFKTLLNNSEFNLSAIENGLSGISFLYSSFLSDQDMVDVVVKYKLKFPNIIFKIKSFQVVQRVRVHGWIGYQREDNEADNSNENNNEEIVYITETGTVYHSTKECSHLTLSIKSAIYSELIDLRNNSGGKYKECELCNGFRILTSNSTVYITDTGDKYHTNAACSGLKRTILEIPLSEVGSRTPCKRCYGN